MSTFVTEVIKEVSIKVNVYKLKINGNCSFDDFFDKYKSNPSYVTQLGHIQSILKYIGSNQTDRIPTQKFKKLKRSKKDKHIDYEIKTKDFRLYLIKDDEIGKIVVLGGIKKTQTKDIRKMRNIKERYFASKPSKKNRK